MAIERFRQIMGRIDTTEAVVKAASGLPDVSVDEAAEVLALARELKVTVGQMRELFGFTPQEIAEARQLVAQIKPGPGSPVAGFETIDRALEFQQALARFVDADEKMMHKLVENDPNLRYEEPRPIKLRRILLNLGYSFWGSKSYYSSIVRPDTADAVILHGYQEDYLDLYVFKSEYKSVSYVEEQRRFLRKPKRITKTRGQYEDERIGFISQENGSWKKDGYDYVFCVEGKRHVPEAIVLSSELSKRLDIKIFIQLIKE